MKRSTSLFWLILTCLAMDGVAVGQRGCDFDLVGTWKSAGGEASAPMFYHFAPDGMLAVLSPSPAGQTSELIEVARAAYRLDASKTPAAIELTAINGGRVFPPGKTVIDITQFDGSALTLASAATGAMRWVRLEPCRYFVVLAARNGTPRDGGPAFVMLIRQEGRETLVETVGLYLDGGHKTIGPIPPALYSQFMSEPQVNSDVMLRLSVTRAEFERSLQTLKDWQRRAREHALLYPPSSPRGLSLNNSVLLKEIAEGLNRCGERIKLYDLNWSSHDEVAVNFNARQVPFQYLKKLRQLNDSLHVRDEEFRQPLRRVNLPGR